MQVTAIGAINGDTRSLDYGSGGARYMSRNLRISFLGVTRIETSVLPYLEGQGDSIGRPRTRRTGVTI